MCISYAESAKEGTMSYVAITELVNKSATVMCRRQLVLHSTVEDTLCLTRAEINIQTRTTAAAQMMRMSRRMQFLSATFECKILGSSGVVTLSKLVN